MRKSRLKGEERATGSGGGGGYRLVALSAEGTLEFDLPARGEFTHREDGGGLRGAGGPLGVADARGAVPRRGAAPRLRIGAAATAPS